MSEWMIGKIEDMRFPPCTKGYRTVMLPLIAQVGIDVMRNLDAPFDAYSVKVQDEAYMIASEVLND